MHCPRCGEEISDDTGSCEYCGFQYRKKNPHYRTTIISFSIIFIVGLSLFYFLRYDTDESDIMIQAAGREMEKGISIVKETEENLSLLRDVHHEIIDHAMVEREYASRSAELLRSAIVRLEEAAYSFERAKTFYTRCQSLHLSKQRNEYLDLELQLVTAYEEYVSILTELYQNYAIYYQFSVPYLTGEHLLVTILSDMDRGNDHLEGENYTFAAAAYESALRKLELLNQEYTQAHAILQLQYTSDFLSNLEYLERALNDLLDAAHQLEEGNVAIANFLALQGMNEVQSFLHINQSAFQTQMALWYHTHITDLQEKKTVLSRQIRALEEKKSKGEW